MTASSNENLEAGRGHRSFASTQWGEVFAAGDSQSPWHADALTSLCEKYWPPVYTYVRRKGHSPEESKDLTQDFFVFLIEHHTIGRADPARGRFRNFLIGCLENFLSVRRRQERARTRGGTQPFVSWDEATAERLYAHVLVHSDSPERTFEKRWAMDLLDRVQGKLQGDPNAFGVRNLMEKLRGRFWDAEGAVPYEELARETGVKPGTLRVMVHRWRRQYGVVLRGEIAASGVPTEEIEDEIRHLLSVLGDS